MFAKLEDNGVSAGGIVWRMENGLIHEVYNSFKGRCLRLAVGRAWGKTTVMRRGSGGGHKDAFKLRRRGAEFLGAASRGGLAAYRKDLGRVIISFILAWSGVLISRTYYSL